MATDKAAPDWEGSHPLSYTFVDATRDHLATTDPDVVTSVISYSVYPNDKVIAASAERTAEPKVPALTSTGAANAATGVTYAHELPLRDPWRYIRYMAYCVCATVLLAVYIAISIGHRVSPEADAHLLPVVRLDDRLRHGW